MTEKRFTYEYDEYNGNLFDNKMNTFYHIEDSDENIEALCDRLNLLVDENEQLKQQLSEQGTQIDFLKDENIHMRQALNENKQLKKQISYYEKLIVDKEEQIIKLKNENNMLKTTIGRNEAYINRLTCKGEWRR